MSKRIINCETGEIIETELTQEDIELWEITNSAILEKQQQDEIRVAARQAILDRLGLSEEEAKLLLG